MDDTEVVPPRANPQDTRDLRRHFEYKIDMAQETRSLWEQLDSEVEPWRRGRFVLVLIAVLNLALQGLDIAALFIVGNIEPVLIVSVVFLLFWLQFYFIWIGVHWIRWVVGAWSGLIGFCWVIWGIRDSNVLMAIFGTANLLVASYFCFSSSVYFFAKRQQEKRSWVRSLAVAAVFLLLLASFYLGGLGLFAYRRQVELEAHEFADDALGHIFTDHDAQFFLDRATPRTLSENFGPEYARAVINHFSSNPGRVHDLKPTVGQVRLNYVFPTKLTSTAELRSEGIGVNGRIEMYIRMQDLGEGWKIDAVLWKY